MSDHSDWEHEYDEFMKEHLDRMKIEEEYDEFMKKYQDRKKLFKEQSTLDNIMNQFNHYESTLHDMKSNNEQNVGKMLNNLLEYEHEKNMTIVEIGAGTGINTKHIVSQLSHDNVSTYITTDGLYYPKIPINKPISCKKIPQITDFSYGLPKPLTYKMKQEQERCIEYRKCEYMKQFENDTTLYTDITIKSAKMDVSDVIKKISEDSSMENVSLLICCPPPIAEISIDLISLVESIDVHKIKYIFIVRFGSGLLDLDGTRNFFKNVKALKNHWKCTRCPKITIHHQSIIIFRDMFCFKRI